ncbi:MAG: M23 family metallopeptidase [Balneolaceae bacterium]|nr:M23 family metallopeptidase [Balneolaceae bacterium]
MTVVLVDHENPNLSGSFKVFSRTLVLVVVSIFLVAGGITTAAFYFTPLGSLYQDRQAEPVREEVQQLVNELNSLQDSIRTRDAQMQMIKSVLIENTDTVLSVGASDNPSPESPSLTGQLFADWIPQTTFEPFSPSDPSLASLQESTPLATLLTPVEGLKTQGFNPQEGHYGLDYAAPEGTPFLAVAEGVVAHRAWTPEFGYTMMVQHHEGYISIYKHASQLLQNVGAKVYRGETLGRVGDRGTLSTGPHLHLELWKNGQPIDPEKMLP